MYNLLPHLNRLRLQERSRVYETRIFCGKCDLFTEVRRERETEREDCRVPVSPK